MIYRKRKDMVAVPIKACMGGEGTVQMEKLLTGPEEMQDKGRAYVRHTLYPGVSIGSHTHEHEMESMVILEGQAIHVINGVKQELVPGDIIVAEPGDTHQIACAGDKPLVLIAQVLYE